MFNLRCNNSGRKMCIAAGGFCSFVVIIAILLQWAMDLPHCSTCVLQRFIFIAMGVAFFVLAFIKHRGYKPLIYSSVCCGLSAWGLSLSAGQVFLMFMGFINTDVQTSNSLLHVAMPILATCSFFLLANISFYLGVGHYLVTSKKDERTTQNIYYFVMRMKNQGVTTKQNQVLKESTYMLSNQHKEKL